MVIIFRITNLNWHEKKFCLIRLKCFYRFNELYEVKIINLNRIRLGNSLS